MRARFRIRTRSGREFTPDSLTAFARLVQTGDVSEPDLIYDALTGEWAPARAHPVYRMVADSILGDQRCSEPPPEDAFGLSLAPPAPERTPEEAVAAMTAEREAERTRDSGAAAPVEGFAIVSGATREATAAVFSAPSSVPTDVGKPLPVRVRVNRTSRRTTRPQHAGGRVMWMMAVLMLASAAVAWPAAKRFATVETDAGREASTPRDRSSRSIPSLDVSARARVAHVVLRDTRALMTELGVGAIPAEWLGGAYLAHAAEYPSVRAEWEKYLALVWAFRATHPRTFREAYRHELEAAGAVGAIRTMRLSAALVDFRGGESARDELIDPIEGVAVAAISLHDLLVHLSGSIEYVPAGDGYSPDPVLEAVGVDPATQELLDDALERFTAVMLIENGGPGTLDAVPEWARARFEAAAVVGTGEAPVP